MGWLFIKVEAKISDLEKYFFYDKTWEHDHLNGCHILF